VSFHPNEVVRRGRVAGILVCGVLVFLLSAFFRTQVLRNQEWELKSETNRLREVPIPAPRGAILDRNNQPIAENVVGYSVELLTQNEDTLRNTMRRLRGTIELTDKQVEDAIKRYRRDRTRPTVIIPDASFDVVSVLEEHRIDFPSLVIQSAPKRIYPAGSAVGSFVGYISEINERELAAMSDQGYKAGQLIGKQGLEKQYESTLHGREGVQFVEVDARNRVVRNGGAREDITPQAGPPLATNIDLDLQTFVQSLFGDTLVGAAIAIVPQTGEVRAIYSAPSPDPNRFVPGAPNFSAYYDSLLHDPRRPLYNNALQGAFPPGSTWKLATSVIGLEDSLVTFDSHMPTPCNGYYYFGNRPWRCWDKNGHGSLNLSQAIAQSCDVYFYQLGQKIGLTRLVAGGVALGFDKKTGIDLPEEKSPIFPKRVPDYFNQKYGARGWTSGAVELNMSIGQGDNAQTVINMARFYSALATDGSEPTPSIAHRAAQRNRVINLSPDQMAQLRTALMGVVSEGGTAAGAAIAGLSIAGKTGTAQTGYQNKNGQPLYDAWFAGFAPANDPKIVVVVLMDKVTFEGSTSARFATQIMSHYLHMNLQSQILTTG